MPALRIKSKPNNVTRRYSFRREVSYTALKVFSMSIDDEDTTAPSVADAVKFALDYVTPIAHTIDWVALSKFSTEALGIPSGLRCGSRFSTSVTLPQVSDTALSALCIVVGNDFEQLQCRAPYRNYVVALTLRAVIADDLGILPRKIAGIVDLSAAPAAFEPSELLSGSACCVPSETACKKHMTFARIDPSIFDQSDLFPNGAVDADGFADDSELF